jgi:hypothetical protein
VRVHRPLSIQTTKQANFIRTFEEFTRSIRVVYDESSLVTVLSRQRKYLHGPEVLALRHVPKILYITCERLSKWCSTLDRSDNPNLLRDLSEEEKAVLVRRKGEVDDGLWEGTMQADGVVAVQMLLEWLNQLSPQLLYEGAEGILNRKSAGSITLTLSESVLKSLALLIPTIRKLAQVVHVDHQHTLYSAFAKALVPFPKSKTTDKPLDDDHLLNAIAFLRDVHL